MQVVHITVYPPKGEGATSKQSGVSQYSKDLITELQKNGVNNTVIAEVIDSKDDYIEDGVRVIRAFRPGAMSIFDIYRLLNTLRYDIVHIQQEKSLFGGLLSAYLLQWLLLILKLRGKKIITTIHGLTSYKEMTKQFFSENGARNMPVLIGKIGFFAIFQPLFWYSSKIIVHNSKLLQKAIEDYGGKSKVECVQIGVLQRVNKDINVAKKQFGISTDEKVVMFFGYVNGYKGLDMLIDAWGIIKSKGYRYKLLIGAGPSPNLVDDQYYLENTYNRLVKRTKEELGFSCIWYAKSVPEEEVVDYFSASDLVVFPYKTMVASSGPLSRALGYGKPYLVSRPMESLALDERLICELDPVSLANSIINFFEHDIATVISFEKILSECNQEYVAKEKHIPIYKSVI
jgi:glycosyltransferase involved in cell wall biosynthesis